MTKVLTRSIPAAAVDKIATPFRVVVPHQLEVDDAMALYKALKADTRNKLQDPFFLQDVSSIFPGVHYGDGPSMDLTQVALTVEFATVDNEAFEDVFVELDVPDALEDAVEALDVTDLTNR